MKTARDLMFKDLQARAKWAKRRGYFSKLMGHTHLKVRDVYRKFELRAFSDHSLYIKNGDTQLIRVHHDGDEFICNKRIC